MHLPFPETLGTVLLVEDEAVLVFDLTDELEETGYRVLDSTPTGEQAIRLAEEHRPDVVVMDVSLSGELSGTQAGQIIHSQLHIPVVYLTAYGNAATLEEIRVAGGSGWLQKPVSVQDLHRAIQRAMRESREFASPPRDPAHLR
jgi:DNA-binding NarL/FixJ family response regulator